MDVIQYRCFLPAVGALLWLTACSDPAPKPVKTVFSGPIMGTTYRVTITAAPKVSDLKNLEAGVLSAMREVDQRMSTYKKHSELSRFNDSHSTDWVAVSQPLVTVLQESIRVSKLSDGAFDVTVGPLVDLWGFGPAGRVTTPPSEHAIEATLDQTGYRYLQLRWTPPALKKDKAGLRIDLSAVAKGYAVDQVCSFLERQGINDYLVDIGGDLRAKGSNDRGSPWTIAIEKPQPGTRVIQRVVQVSGFALATSGDYRNYFEKDGRRFSHTIDPRSGSPITHQLASVSVASEQAMHADALATALMVLGPERGMALARKLGLAVFMVSKGDNGFVEHFTDKFAGLFVSNRLAQ